jgi:hypothetical protein
MVPLGSQNQLERTGHQGVVGHLIIAGAIVLAFEAQAPQGHPAEAALR